MKRKQTHDEAAYECYTRYCADIGVSPATYASWLKLTTRISAVNWLGKDECLRPRPLGAGGMACVGAQPDYATA
ncbi:MAG: hypothetical protein WAK20_01540 [Candidatus Acidiferrum sp.]